MAKQNRIICRYTKREWILIEHRVKLLGKKSIFNYLVSEIKALETEFETLTQVNAEFGKVERRVYYPPDHIQKIIEDLAKKMNLPPSTVVSRLLLSPLLKYQLIL